MFLRQILYGATSIRRYTYYQIVGPQTNIERGSVEERRDSPPRQWVQN